MRTEDAGLKYRDLYRELRLSGVGCSDVEISSFERDAGVSLPVAYREFLRANGNEPDDMFRGSDCGLRYLPNLRAWATNLLAESGASYSLPESAFVFFMHQGYQFLFFDVADAAPDPSVFYYCEGDLEPRCSNPTFSHWVREFVESVRTSSEKGG
jgi:hypothetical protein